MQISLRTYGLLFSFCALFPAFGQCLGPANAAAVTTGSAEAGPIVLPPDQPLPAYQNDLLELAMDAATVIPIEPHIKDRSKAQEKVVEASLELKQPARALRYILQIDDWRRGACFADLAYQTAQGGLTSQTQRMLDIAERMSESEEDWRRDTIRVKIARVHLFLGHPEQAERLETGVVDSQKGKVAGYKASQANDPTFDDQVKSLDAMIGTGNFDIQRNALDSYTQLYDRFYSNAQRRSAIEKKITGAWTKMPIFARIELLTNLTQSALSHHDNKKALELIDQCQSLVDGSQWPPEDRLPLDANLVKLRFAAGDKSKARKQAEAARAFYNEQREKIVNIWRGGALRPLAEAFQKIGDPATALALYKKAIDEGVENPNSRPRAEDLSATCCSMALAGAEPGTELWQRIHEVRNGLGQPW